MIYRNVVDSKYLFNQGCLKELPMIIDSVEIYNTAGGESSTEKRYEDWYHFTDNGTMIQLLFSRLLISQYQGYGNI